MAPSALTLLFILPHNTAKLLANTIPERIEFTCDSDAVEFSLNEFH